jgi:hypothetical protein
VDVLNAGGVYDTFGFGFMVFSSLFHFSIVFASFSQSGLERLVEGIPFEVLNQLRDSVRVGPGFAAVVAGS